MINLKSVLLKCHKLTLFSLNPDKKSIYNKASDRQAYGLQYIIDWVLSYENIIL